MLKERERQRAGNQELVRCECGDDIGSAVASVVETEEDPTTTPGTSALNGREPGAGVLAATGLEERAADSDLRDIGFGRRAVGRE